MITFESEYDYGLLTLENIWKEFEVNTVGAQHYSCYMCC